MNRKDRRKAQKLMRGWQKKDPVLQGTDELWDLKIQKELAKMMMAAHLQELHEHLPEDEAKNIVYRWMDESGNEGEMRV